MSSAVAAAMQHQIVPMGDHPPSLEVLDLARWAPSGDNEQPWYFEDVTENSFTVVIGPYDPANPYEYANGRPVWFSGGALLEAIDISSRALGFMAVCLPLEGENPSDHSMLKYKVSLEPLARPSFEPLANYLTTRTVDRTSYSTRYLTFLEKAALNQSLPRRFSVAFLENLPDRWQMAKLNAEATVLRLQLSSTYPVHKRILHFGNPCPKNGLAVETVPMDPASRKFMKWALKKETRFRLFNKTLGGARPASLQTDIIPGLNCGAHFLITTSTALSDDRLAAVYAGRAIMRFWLVAEQLGLSIQPGFAPLCFGHQAQTSKSDFNEREHKRARHLGDELTRIGGDLDKIVFLGRIGEPRRKSVAFRSQRRPLSELIKSTSLDWDPRPTGLAQ